MAKPTNDAQVMVTSLRSLLLLTESATLADVADHVDEAVMLETDCETFAYNDDASSGFELRLGSRGVSYEYPFDLHDLYADAQELEELYWFDVSCETLAEEIAMVEGIDVAVEIDWDCDERTVRSSANRRELFGEIIQAVPEYPYMRAMGGSRTFEECRTIRFDRHYAGLAIDGPSFEASETLAALRRQKFAATAAPRPGTPRCACERPAAKNVHTPEREAICITSPPSVG